jgi:hypothetical protein
MVLFFFSYIYVFDKARENNRIRHYDDNNDVTTVTQEKIKRLEMFRKNRK